METRILYKMENKKISIHLLFLSFSFGRNFPDSLFENTTIIYIFIKFSTLDQSSLFQKLIHRSLSILLGKQNAKFEYFSCEFGWSKNNFEEQIEVHYRGLLWTTQEWNLPTYSPRVDAFRRLLANIFLLGDAMIFTGEITIPTSKSELEESCFKISVKYRSPLVYIFTKKTDKYFNLFSFLFNKMHMNIVEENIYLSFLTKRKISPFLEDKKIENASISLFPPHCFSFQYFFSNNESE